MDEDSSPENSRPSSVAQSDATEVPDFHQGPRTLAHDIEHIKSLISRSATASRGPETSISAQIFRSRSGSSGSNGPVSQARLFHELDLLKKRVKHEQHHTRSLSQIDPETESESEDAIDEREEELENIRERLLQERRQSEDLLVAAETRIDRLSEEKDDLSKLLESNRDDLAKLQALKADVDAALTKSDEKIKELEENNKVASDEVKRLIADHQSREEESRHLHEDLQARHDKYEQEVQASQSKIQQLEQSAKEHETIKAQVESLSKQRDESRSQHEAQRNQLQQELEDAKSGHSVELEQVRSQHQEHVRTIQDASDAANRRAQNAELQSSSSLEDLNTRLTIEQQENESLHEQLKTKEDLHVAQVKSAEERIAQMEQALAEFEKRAVNAESSLRSKEEQLGGDIAAKESEIAEIQRELSELHKKLYDQSLEIQEKHAELSKAAEYAETAKTAVSLNADLAKALEERDAANQGWQNDIARFEAEQEALKVALQEGWSSEASQAARAHHAELSSAHDQFQKAIAELSASSERRITRLNEDRTGEVAKLKEELQLEVSALKKNHKRELSRAHGEAEKELATALASADDDLDERLRAQSKAHRKELDKLNESLNVELTQLHVQLEEAAQLRQSQMEDAESQHREALVMLQDKLQIAEEALSALQVRLDAELTGRAEAERSLAGFRKQRFDEDAKNSEAREALKNQIDALEAEKVNLTKELQATPRSIQSEFSDLDKSQVSSLLLASSEDTQSLKERLAATEQERDQALASAGPNINELLRQNEFLVKELETMMAQRNDDQTSKEVQHDVAVQTDPVHVLIHEPKADMATSTAAKLQRQISLKQVQDLQEAGAKRKSFEDYLKLAQAELSGLGVDLSANEELFTEKTQEHMGNLQTAKEDLSAEYQRKFGTLLSEKARMERLVSAKNASEFTRARRELLTRYGIQDDDPVREATMITSLPTRKKRAFWGTEAILVSEYNRRVTKRRSQIAVKHAEKFHTLTQDHNRRIKELIDGKDIPEGEFTTVNSAEQSQRSTQDYSISLDTALQSGSRPMATPSSGIERSHLENALKAAAETSPATPKSKLPQRISISKPRTPTSIPRAVPYRSEQGNEEVASHSRKASAAPDLSASATDDQVNGQASAGSKGSEPVTPDIVEAFRRLSLDPAEGEGDAVRKDLKKSMDVTRPQRSRPRAMRHSSRAIFGFQATNDS